MKITQTAFDIGWNIIIIRKLFCQCLNRKKPRYIVFRRTRFSPNVIFSKSDFDKISRRKKKNNCLWYLFKYYCTYCVGTVFGRKQYIIISLSQYFDIFFFLMCRLCWSSVLGYWIKDVGTHCFAHLRKITSSNVSVWG